MLAWEQFLQQLESELGNETVQKWLRSLKIASFDACNLYLEAKDSFQVLWFEEHIRSKVQTTLLNGNHHKIKVHLSIKNGPPTKSKSRTPIKETKGTAFQLQFDEPDPYCQFESFIINNENHETYHLLHELVEKSALGTFNPVYLHGPTGSGKTHLLMSLTHSFRSMGHQALYVRAEQFTDHVISAIRAGEMTLFRQAYRKAQILLVDDVQVFSRKGATQEEFFHTFNTLHLDGKQIILAANCPPQELQLIEPRLVSRFEWGIVLSLKTLEEHERKKMLLAKSSALQFPLSTKVQDFLLETFASSPKALTKSIEALALRLHSEDSTSSENLSIQAVKTLLSDLILEEQKSALTPVKIVQSVAEHYGITIDDILGKAQTRECTLPRQIAMHLCREKLKMPFIKIGDFFSRDHSTVMTSVKSIQKSIEEEDQEIAWAWQAITKKI